MQKMTIEENKATIGGTLSGSLLSGIADIIDAITNFITSLAGIAYVFEGNDHTHSKGDFKFGKNLSFNWDDTKPKGENLVAVDFTDHQIEGQNEISLINHAYDLT